MGAYGPALEIPFFSVLAAVGIVLLCVRFWVRLSLAPVRLGADDALSVAGLVFLLCLTGIQLWNMIVGSGAGPDDVAHIVNSKKANNAQVLVEVLAMGSIKLSFLFFYRRIFAVVPSFDRLSFYCICFVAVWTATFFIAQVSICGTKMHFVWTIDGTFARDHCGDRALVLLVFAITGVLTDMLVLGLPMIYLAKVQMPRQKKWQSGIVFLIGTLSTVGCILRTAFLCVAYPLGALGWVPPPEFEMPLAMRIFDPVFWTMIEMWLGSWASNLATTGPLYFMLYGAWRQRQRRSTRPGGELRQAYEMGSTMDKVHTMSAVEELENDGDEARIMGHAASHTSFASRQARNG